MRAQLRSLLQQTLSALIREKSKSLRYENLGFYLQQRAARLDHEVSDITRRESSLAFRDVTGDGDSSATKLGSQPVTLLWRKALGGAIDLYNKLHCFLPSNEISIVFCHGRLRLRL